MRRDTRPGQHPNGLIEFLVAGTIAELRDRGHRGLGLHFAAIRAILAGDLGDRFWQRNMTRLMHRLGDDMQIESLWHFNAKFDPHWLPRYLVLDGQQSTLPRRASHRPARSLWELPVIGRLLRPSSDAFAPVT